MLKWFSRGGPHERFPIELKDRVKRMTVFQTYVFYYYFWVNLDARCPHTVTVYPDFSTLTGVNYRTKFNMRIAMSYVLIPDTTAVCTPLQNLAII